MKSKYEYEVNQHISLKLHRNKTYVYIDNEEIRLCKNLAVNIPINQLDDINKIKSIDDLEFLLHKRFSN